MIAALTHVDEEESKAEARKVHVSEKRQVIRELKQHYEWKLNSMEAEKVVC